LNLASERRAVAKNAIALKVVRGELFYAKHAEAKKQCEGTTYNIAALSSPFKFLL